jgi:hypothetical protein
MARTVEDKKERLIRFWEMANHTYVPYIIELGNFHAATSKYFFSGMEELKWTKDYFKKLRHIDDYSIPNIKPNTGIGTVATIFGCEWKTDEQSDPWIKPIVFESNIDAVKTIAPQNILESLVVRLGFDKIEYFETHSEFPIRMLNIASPLVTASLIWEYNSFLMSMIDHPRKVHSLLEIVTDVTIEFVKLQQGAIKNLYTMGHESYYLPQGMGVRVSDDVAAVLSPALYREFGVPYNNRLARAFDGLVVHSCGAIEHIIPEMLEISGLRGIDFVITQNNWDRIREITAGKTSMIYRFFSTDFFDDTLEKTGLAEYGERLIDCFGREGTMLLTNAPDVKSAHELGRQLKRICEV